MHVRAAVLLSLLLPFAALAQQGLTPPPPPPTDPAQPLDVAPYPSSTPPPQQQGVLVPKTIANAPLEPEKPTNTGPTPSGITGHQVGFMLHVALNFVNRFWQPNFPVLPGFGGTFGVRVAVLQRSDLPQFNVAVGGFFGIEAINWVPVISPGVRVELMGLRGTVLLPYLSLSAFSQVLAPTNGDPVGLRGGIALSWNLAALPGNMPWWRMGNVGGGSNAWVLIPLAIIGAVIAFGDVRLFIQTSPVGGVIGGLSLGVGL